LIRRATQDTQDEPEQNEPDEVQPDDDFTREDFMRDLRKFLPDDNEGSDDPA
jgi:hypothetical protein